jgi:hypothetical protein
MRLYKILWAIMAAGGYKVWTRLTSTEMQQIENTVADIAFDLECKEIEALVKPRMQKILGYKIPNDKALELLTDGRVRLDGPIISKESGNFDDGVSTGTMKLSDG